jgi:hypothetical protein
MSKEAVKRGLPARDQYFKSLLKMSFLSNLELRTAVALGTFLNCTHGQCNPGYPKLAKELGVMTRSARRAVAALVAHGIVEVEGSAGGSHEQTSNFRLFILPERVTDSVSPVETSDEPERVTANVSPVTGDGQANGRVTKPNLTGDEPAQGRVTPRGPHNTERNTESNTERAASPRSSLVTTAVMDQRERAFGALLEAYPNKTRHDDSRATFEQLIEDGLNPDELIAEAKLYATKCIGMKQRDIHYLCRWLKVEAQELLEASCFSKMGRAAKSAGATGDGLRIDQDGNMLDDITTAPRAGAGKIYQSHHEAAYEGYEL